MSFSFAAQVQGSVSLASPITLAVSGLPQFATASFNPTYIPPGSATANFTLTVSIPKSHIQRKELPAVPLTIGILFLPLLGLGRRKTGRYFLGIFATLAAITLSGCGDRIYSGTQSISNAASYTITVTGTATAPSGTVLQHATNVTLIVQQN